MSQKIKISYVPKGIRNREILKTVAWIALNSMCFNSHGSTSTLRVKTERRNSSARWISQGFYFPDTRTSRIKNGLFSVESDFHQ
uniref:Uncharacterized protein n=1 Tax=Candidatus Kentrum sp. SD TaxID=2126332 RepID=A0A451BKI0_9GAMM|nr:MAG: hypothetical protein BECKSD772F_GA0070984_101420 [Candidatus Kentron sp. SD]VFK43742.1 MAG: hypothetical protein BECKSD772E_GA0070983_10293 [Candidatus Kentron sp. SD]VFK78738.1 MAG: hypothetical protein BECKSD772D_GA0070982_102323 [Candidatus Kentron sp. SD]